MTKNVETISPKTTLDAIHIMKARGFRHLPVVENKKLSEFSPCGYMTMLTMNCKTL